MMTSRARPHPPGAFSLANLLSAAESFIFPNHVASWFKATKAYTGKVHRGGPPRLAG
jgi:hypothetical protein